MIWSAREPHRLSKEAKRILQNPGSRLMWSVVGTCELAIKCQKGHLDLGDDVRTFVLKGMHRMGLELLSLEQPHAYQLAAVPRHHGDPFDRMLIAQAQAD